MSNDLMPAPKEVISIPSGEDIANQLIQFATIRLEKMKRLKELAMQVTNYQDWVDFGGKPWMTTPGAEKVGRLFGIRIRETHYKKEKGTDDKGDYYFYVYSGKASLPGDYDEIEVVGTCSSRDEFFAVNKGEDRPLSEIDETDIMKAAMSNMMQNGITRLLGIRNCTWEELKNVANIDKVARVSFDKKDKDRQAESKDEGGEKEKNRLSIVDMLLEINGGDETAAKDQLKSLTAWGKFTGVNHSKEMLNWDPKRIYAVMNKIKGLYKEKFGKDYEPKKESKTAETKAENQDQGKDRPTFIKLIIKDAIHYSESRKIDLGNALKMFLLENPKVKAVSDWQTLEDDQIDSFYTFLKNIKQ